MPIIATGTLITMGIQTIVTLVNQRLNSKNAAEIKKNAAAGKARNSST